MPQETAAVADTARRERFVLLACVLGIFLALLDVSIVNVALPTIRGDLGGSLTSLEWVVNAYVLTLAVLILAAGRLGDLRGRRTVYVGGLVTFAAGSAICGLASDMTWLHAGRVVQGAGGAAILPLSLALLHATFSGRRLAGAIGLWGAAGGLATALGPLVGGLLVEHLGWEAIFYLNLPIAAIAVLLALRHLPDARDPEAPRSLDLPGVLTAGAALLLLNLGLIEGADRSFGSPGVIALFAGFLLAALLLAVVEARSPAPMLDPRVLRNRSLMGAALAGLFLGMGMFAMFFFLAIFLQAGIGASPQQAGAYFLPLSAMLIVAARLSPKLTERFGGRSTAVAGMGLVAVGLALMTLLEPGGDTASWTRLLPGLIVGGLGLGVAFPVLSALVVAAAPPEQAGIASSIGTMFRQVGNAVGIAVLGAVISAHVGSSAALAGTIDNGGRVLLGEGLQTALWCAVGVTLVGAVVCRLLVRPTPPGFGASADGAPHMPARPRVAEPALNATTARST